MTFGDWLIVGGCLVLGYWLVLRTMDGPRGTQASPPDPEPRAEPPPREEAKADPAPDPARGIDASLDVTLRNWYRILGVAETAGAEEIAAAYRRLIRQYHPDKVEGLGVELRQLANEKSKQLNAAYELGMRRFR